MASIKTNLPKPFEVTFALRLLWLSLLLTACSTLLYCKTLISLMSVNLDLLSRSLLFFSNNVFYLAITIWLLSKVSIGQNWARHILFLGFVIIVPITIPILIEMYGHGKAYVFISAVILLFQFVGLSLLYSDAGNAWFKTGYNEKDESSIDENL